MRFWRSPVIGHEQNSAITCDSYLGEGWITRRSSLIRLLCCYMFGTVFFFSERFVTLTFMSLAGGIICSRELLSVFREKQRSHMVNTLRMKDSRTDRIKCNAGSLYARRPFVLSGYLQDWNAAYCPYIMLWFGGIGDNDGARQTLLGS